MRQREARTHSADGSKKSLAIIIITIVVALAAIAGYVFWISGQEVSGGGQVTITDDAFAPETIQIAIGQTVVWTNQGDETHAVRGEVSDNLEFDSGELRRGDSFTYRFEEAGRYTYYDERSQVSMQGTIVVR